MLLSIFSEIYQALIGKNDDPIYEDEVFFAVGLFTLLIAFVSGIVFYIGLGRWKPLFYGFKHWIITLLLVLTLTGLLALQQSKDATQTAGFDAYMVRFAMFNALYAVICFIIFSLLLKRFSIFAKRTPF